jgi:23S rRNA (guanosine2251-2'-O)-methyltransferase
MHASPEEIIYGRQPVHETIRARRRRILGLYMKQTAKPSPDLEAILRSAEKAKVPVKFVEERDLARLTEGGHHQGIAVRVDRYPYVSLDDLLAGIKGGSEPALVLILDHIQDPQNLGSILRTAEVAGVPGVVIPADRAVGVTPAAVRASAGASEHVQIAEVTNLVRTMKVLKDEGLWIAGLESVPEAKLYTTADLKGPLGLVVGSEGEGLGRLVRENCDFLISLPLYGHIGSLNAGVACAIALYEIRRQRGVKQGDQA